MGKHYGVDRGGVAVFVRHGNLALRVRAQPGQFTGMALCRQRLQKTVGIYDGRRHEYRRLARRIPEHHALVAGAQFLLDFAIDAARNVRRLAVEVILVAQGVEGELLVGAVVPGLLDNTAHDFLGFELSEHGGRDFSHIYHEIRRHDRFASHTRILVLLETRIEDSVGDAVCQFVRMSL